MQFIYVLIDIFHLLYISPILTTIGVLIIIDID
jgi:hypothetical protein